MFQLVYWFHIVLCAVLVGIVLLQQGKGADAGAILSGGTDSVLGAGSAGNFVTKLTTTLAITFMVTSIILVRAYKYAPHQESPAAVNGLEGSVMEEVAEQQAEQAATTVDVTGGAEVVEQTASEEAGSADGETDPGVEAKVAEAASEEAPKTEAIEAQGEAKGEEADKVEPTEAAPITEAAPEGAAPAQQ